MKTSLYPKVLKARQDDFVSPFKRLLEEKKIRVWQAVDRTIGYIVSDWRIDNTPSSLAAQDEQPFNDLLDGIERDFDNVAIGPEKINEAISRIREILPGRKANASKALRRLQSELRELVENLRPQAPQECRVTVPDIVKRLNDDQHSSLIVIQGADPDELRAFASLLGNAIYENRRHSGQISPLVSFLFDEADEFIPLNYERDSSYARSSGIAMTLARRGRKFGLGIGIATQRVTSAKGTGSWSATTPQVWNRCRCRSMQITPISAFWTGLSRSLVRTHRSGFRPHVPAPADTT